MGIVSYGKLHTDIPCLTLRGGHQPRPGRVQPIQSLSFFYFCFFPGCVGSACHDRCSAALGENRRRAQPVIGREALDLPGER
jgi:hypothetical protein